MKRERSGKRKGEGEVLSMGNFSFNLGDIFLFFKWSPRYLRRNEFRKREIERVF